MTREVAILDAGVGNLRSVAKAFEALGARAIVTTKPDVIRRGEFLVVPGQGAFGDCMKGLGGEVGDALVESLQRGAHYLGICLGLQILFEASCEGGRFSGLGLLPGLVRRLERKEQVKLPHMGWNEVEFIEGTKAHYYFAHSYYADPIDETLVWGRTSHGQAFCAAIRRENLWAVQFHPEKSQRAGLQLLERFLCG